MTYWKGCFKACMVSVLGPTIGFQNVLILFSGTHRPPSVPSYEISSYSFYHLRCQTPPWVIERLARTSFASCLRTQHEPITTGLYDATWKCTDKALGNDCGTRLVARLSIVRQCKYGGYVSCPMQSGRGCRWLPQFLLSLVACTLASTQGLLQAGKQAQRARSLVQPTRTTVNRLTKSMPWIV
jgi:hypothetical protein